MQPNITPLTVMFTPLSPLRMTTALGAPNRTDTLLFWLYGTTLLKIVLLNDPMIVSGVFNDIKLFSSQPNHRPTGCTYTPNNSVYADTTLSFNMTFGVPTKEQNDITPDPFTPRAMHIFDTTAHSLQCHICKPITIIMQTSALSLKNDFDATYTEHRRLTLWAICFSLSTAGNYNSFGPCSVLTRRMYDSIASDGVDQFSPHSSQGYPFMKFFRPWRIFVFHNTRLLHAITITQIIQLFMLSARL